MNRQQAKDMLPIIQALAEGKHIQLKDRIGNWIDIDFINVELCNPNNYRIKRIKSEPKYRPFANADECWQEMQKHEPFGWVKNKETGRLSLIGSLEEHLIIDGLPWYFDRAFSTYIFTDGTPFGIKEE